MAFSFAAPLFLLALLALPALWWLLRLTPPKPRSEVFPPLKLLLKLTQKEETQAQNPWWLLLLRLALAALFIIALAQPVWQPHTQLVAEKRPLVLVIDNSWAAATAWKKHLRTAQDLVDEAQARQAPVYIIATAEPADRDTGPFDSHAARRYLDNLRPRALYADREAAFARLDTIRKTAPDMQLAYLTDGLATAADQAAFQLAEQAKATPFLWYQGDISMLTVLDNAENTAGLFTLSGLRAESRGEKTWTVTAHDRQGRRIGATELVFANGETRATATLDLPLEIRNDVVSLHLEGGNHAGAARLLGTGEKYRRIAILAPATAELNQPLLSPLYYVSTALAPSGEIIHAGNGTLTENINRLLAAKPAVLIMGDVAGLPAAVADRLTQWINGGGTLVRFAGPGLAAATGDDALLPVRLRRGERSLGGALSWESPQKIAPFPAESPFASMTPPDDVTISRQILAEPSATLYDQSWANLADGTPLITAQNRGKGRIVFIHTSAGPDWSNLPLSGFFVDMLSRITATANQPLTEVNRQRTQSLAPWRILSANGSLEPPPASIKPLQVNGEKMPAPSSLTPPGLYGGKQALAALNLFDTETRLSPLQIPVLPGISKLAYGSAGSLSLHTLLWVAALGLFALDCLLVFFMSGFPRRFGKRLRPAALSVLISGLCLLAYPAQPVQAQDAAAQAAGKTHLAYIITGNTQTDRVSEAGLESLTQFIEQRTTVSPGPVTGLDPEKDELAFYPLIYWPVDPDSPMPSAKAIERINAYMQQGGTVLFDTRDQLNAGLNLDGKASPATQRLRDILAGLAIPPLEPAPPDHVIARSFFLMPDFPGRYRGSPLWITATAADQQENRLTRSGDGVSPILITANDLAGAWAHDGKGGWLFPLVPDDGMQRVWAFRGGLNIVLYMLSGNYKADQVHAPELLKRLGR